jgi:glutamine amidotransferase
MEEITMIGIVDYGMGNLMSVFNAFEYIGAEVIICHTPDELSLVDRIVIPGVGAISECIRKLNESGFSQKLDTEVLKIRKPTLGICLGMQVMAKVSYEGGMHKCLGWFDAEVVRLNPGSTDMKVPNIGWNQVNFKDGVPLFQGLSKNSDLYLVHSFHVKPVNLDEIAASYNYGEVVTAAIIKDNIFATQFHPEKSQDLGLKILENFINWNP